MAEDPRCPDCGGYRGLPRMLHHEDTPVECSNPFHSETPAPVVEEEKSNVVEMPAPAAAAAPAVPAEPKQLPICPYCNEIGKIGGHLTNLGPVEVMVVTCRNCHKILGAFQPLMLQMQPPPAGFPPPPGLKN
jgi:hypothetical protein